MTRARDLGNLGSDIGTAATEDITTSATDTTAGRLLKVGDFGIGFTEKFNDMTTLGQLSNFLKERNIQMYAIRGNHDDPDFFDGHLENYFDNLHLLPDYTVINIDGVKTPSNVLNFFVLVISFVFFMNVQETTSEYS